MSHTLKDSKPRRSKPSKERRAPRGTPGSVRWLGGLLGRPVGFQRRNGQLHVALIERRRSPETIEADEVAALSAELRTRLLAHDHEQAAAVMRHLVLVHDVLSHRGWAGVASMASGLLRKAVMQAQLLAQSLASQESSAPLVELIDRLRLLQVAAGLREERQAKPGVPAQTNAPDSEVEISETTPEEFEAMQRSWVDTVSPAEVLPERVG